MDFSQSSTYMPYRAAQRRANKIQPFKDQEEVPPVEPPLQTAVKSPSGNANAWKSQTPASQPYGAQQTTSTSPPTTQTSSTGRPWEAPESSRYAPRVIQQNGQWYLTEHGNRRLLDPTRMQDDSKNPGQQISELDAAKRYQEDFWTQNPTGFMPGVGPQQNKDYRAPRASMDMFGNFAGFDAGNYQNEDRDKSAKYTFADAAASSGYVPKTKEEAEQWALEFVVPELEARGYTVHWVQGDKMMVSTRENPQGEVIDFIQNAGGDNPMFAWQPESGGPQETALQSAIGATSNPLVQEQSFGGLPGVDDPLQEMLRDPQWRQMLARLGVKI